MKYKIDNDVYDLLMKTTPPKSKQYPVGHEAIDAVLKKHVDAR